jgi:hypothetical protein
MRGRKAAALLCLLVLLLAGCGGEMSRYDAASYIEGLVHASYLGEGDAKYLDLVGLTQEEVREDFETGLDRDADWFFRVYRIEDVTGELREQVRDLFAQVYGLARVEVVSSLLQQDGSYAVKVMGAPVNIVRLVEQDWDRTTRDFFEEYPPEEVEKLSAYRRRRVDRLWGELVLSLYQDKLPESGGLDPVSMTLQLEKNDKGLYTLSDREFARLDSLILDRTQAGSRLEE